MSWSCLYKWLSGAFEKRTPDPRCTGRMCSNKRGTALKVLENHQIYWPNLWDVGHQRTCSSGKWSCKVLWIIPIVTVTTNWECNMPTLMRSRRWVRGPANWQSVMTFFKMNIFVYRLNLIMKYIKGNSGFAVSSENCVIIDKNWE